MCQKIRLTALLTLAVMTGAAFAAIPQVSNVTMGQIAGTRNVRITYDLTVTNAIITLMISTNDVVLPDSAVITLVGDVNKQVEIGNDKEIIWHAGQDWPEHVTTEAKALVTAWSVDNPPQYCVVDLLAGPSAGTSEYPVYYYLSTEGVPNGVDDVIYKTYRMPLRRIYPTGAVGFSMGSPNNEVGRISGREAQVNVVLTKSFYMGVYMVTQRQWAQVMNIWPAHFNNPQYCEMRPVEKVSYEDIRGKESNNPKVDWPDTRDYVNPNSFLGRLRKRTGLQAFDLPTEAQWEWACRASTTGALNDGTVNLANENSDPNLDTLGRYIYNGGLADGGVTSPDAFCTTSNGTATVGSYLPNAWGLYDMHGNAYEWCLNWYTGVIDGGIDPKGATSGSSRVRRGGRYAENASSCRCAHRNASSPSESGAYIGFRILCNLP